MTYTAKTAKEMRTQKGTLLYKVSTENGLIETELAAIPAAARKFLTLTPVTGTNTAIGTAGIDLASGADITVYGFWFPKAATLVKMHDVLTEAYAKDTGDAKITVYADLAGGAALLFTRTLTAAGELVRAAHATSPEAGASAIAAGTMVYLTAVHTEAGGGTGHALVSIEYTEA